MLDFQPDRLAGRAEAQETGVLTVLPVAKHGIRLVVVRRGRWNVNDNCGRPGNNRSVSSVSCVPGSSSSGADA